MKREDEPEIASAAVFSAAAPKPRRAGALWKPALLFLAVFALGGVAGGGIVRACTLSELRTAMRRGPPAQAFARFRLEALRRRLNLSDAQVESINAVLERTHEERARALSSCGASLEETRARVDAEIVAFLTPEQQRAYTEFAAEEPRHPGPRAPRRPPPEGAP